MPPAPNPSVTTNTLIHAYNLHLAPCRTPAAARNCVRHPNCVVKERLCRNGIWKQVPEALASRRASIARIERDENVPVGIRNMGATCYISCLLQCLFMNIRLRRALYAFRPPGSEESQEDFSIVLGLQKLFASLQLSMRRDVCPTEFIDLLRVTASDQQDLQEFNKLLLSHLQSRFSLSEEPTVREFVQDELGGEFLYVTECQKCHSRSCSRSRFYELSLPLANTLENSLAEFTKVEHLSGDDRYLCPRCQTKQEATRQLQLTRPPPVLNIQLLRFAFDIASLSKQKDHRAVMIPFEFDLSNTAVNSIVDYELELVDSFTSQPLYASCDFCSIRYRYSAQRSVHKCVECHRDLRTEAPVQWTYELCTVLGHHGAGAHSGHYVADIKCEEYGKWFHFNDDQVTEIKLGDGELASDATSLTSKSAYMLVYMRRDCQQEAGEPYVPVSNYLASPIHKDNEVYMLEMQRLNQDLAITQDSIDLRKRHVEQLLSWSQSNSEPTDGRLVPLSWLCRWVQGDESLKSLEESDYRYVVCKHGFISPFSLERVKHLSHRSMKFILSNLRLNASALGPERTEGKNISVHESSLSSDGNLTASVPDTKVDKLDVASLENSGPLSCPQNHLFLGRLPESLCLKCVEAVQNCKRWVEQKETINQILAALKSNQADPGNGLWISNKFVKQCFDNVKKVVRYKSKQNMPPPPCFFSPVEPIICQHGKLSLAASSRGRIVSVDVFNLMQEVGWISHSELRIGSSATECALCFQSHNQHAEKRRSALDSRRQEFLALKRARRAKCAFPSTVWRPGVGEYRAIPWSWFEEWKAFARSHSLQIPQPSKIPMHSLRCHHQRLSRRIQSSSDSTSSMALLTQTEFEVLCKSYGVEGDPVVIRVSSDSRGDAKIDSLPEVCDECCKERAAQEVEAAFVYEQGVIRVQRRALDEKPHEEDKQQQQRKRPRRSKAGIRFCNQVEVTVNSWHTIHTLKLLVFQEWDYTPGQQRMFFNRQELQDHRTLAEYSIPVESVVTVVIRDDQVYDERDLIIVDGCERPREKGFVGSALTL